MDARIQLLDLRIICIRSVPLCLTTPLSLSRKKTKIFFQKKKRKKNFGSCLKSSRNFFFIMGDKEMEKDKGQPDALTTPISFQDWIVHPQTREPIDTLLEIAAWDVSADELEGTGMTDVQYKLYTMIAIPHARYGMDPHEKTFYTSCLTHVGELYAAMVNHPDEMQSFADCIYALASSMYNVDALTDGQELLPSMTPEERLRVADESHEGLRVFARCFSEGISVLQAYPAACLMFVEFARSIFRFNAYQPLPRTVHEAYKIPLEAKGEFNYWDEFIENLERYLALDDVQRDDQQQPPPPPPDDERVEQQEVELECEVCDTAFLGKLNSSPAPSCPVCAANATQ